MKTSQSEFAVDGGAAGGNRLPTSHSTLGTNGTILEDNEKN